MENYNKKIKYKEKLRKECCNPYNIIKKNNRLTLHEYILIKSKEDIFCYCCNSYKIGKIISRSFPKCERCNCCNSYKNYYEYCEFC